MMWMARIDDHYGVNKTTFRSGSIEDLPKIRAAVERASLRRSPFKRSIGCWFDWDGKGDGLSGVHSTSAFIYENGIAVGDVCVWYYDDGVCPLYFSRNKFA